MLAAELGNYAIVALLSQSNANLKIQDNEGKGKQKHWVEEYYLAFFIGCIILAKPYFIDVFISSFRLS